MGIDCVGNVSRRVNFLLVVEAARCSCGIWGRFFFFFFGGGGGWGGGEGGAGVLLFESHSGELRGFEDALSSGDFP